MRRYPLAGVSPRPRENPATTWRILNLEQAIGEPETVLRERACRAVGVDAGDLRSFRIARRALDARRHGGARRLRYVVHVDVELDAGLRAPGLARAEKSGRARRRPAAGTLGGVALHASLATGRVAVVGAGPAGLFAALTLARNGCAVDLLDRGASLVPRSRALARFLRTRELDPESNLLYGEGGAGTYSDGKVYTRIDHPLEAPILEELVACGAPAEIAYDARAHIGTDRLHRVLPRLREHLCEAGVRLHFGVRVDALVLRGDAPRRVVALATSEGELACDAVLLAPGHSARDTLRALHTQGVEIVARPFQLGVRIEHPQSLIDRSQHGTGPEAEQLGAAYYSLVCRARGAQPAVHSFCMCPGGQIVASVNTPGLLCTNGMSNSRHSSPFATAALVATFDPAQHGSGPFAGVAWQEALERRFFEAGGGDFTAPAQRACDFLAGRQSEHLGATSYKLGVVPGRIDTLLPPEVTRALAGALVHFERRVPGFAGPDGLLIGVEARSASPVRLPRDAETFRATGLANLLPVGEGAGYAGGITSAAIDGARAAQALLRCGVG